MKLFSDYYNKMYYSVLLMLIIVYTITLNYLNLIPLYKSFRLQLKTNISRKRIQTFKLI